MLVGSVLITPVDANASEPSLVETNIGCSVAKKSQTGRFCHKTDTKSAKFPVVSPIFRTVVAAKRDGGQWPTREVIARCLKK
jgi:hypothetical protein